MNDRELRVLVTAILYAGENKVGSRLDMLKFCIEEAGTLIELVDEETKSNEDDQG